MSERDRIGLLAAIFGSGQVPVGIGDDAAVLEGGLVWTVDAQIEETHFRRAWVSWHDVGFRSFMAAASDLAAMGAQPIGALSALALPDDVDDAAFTAIVEGQAEASRAVGAPIVGGNLARGREASITTTLLGRCERPLLRSGARPRDGVWVAGGLGMAAAGLAALQVGGDLLQNTSVQTCIDTWRRPRALVETGLGIAGASAGADVSDGLSRDAANIAEASGVCIVLDELQLRDLAAGALTVVAEGLQRDPLDFVLGGGEDYALLVTSPTPLPGFVRIGYVVVGEGIALLRPDGSTARLEPRGYDHFR